VGKGFTAKSAKRAENAEKSGGKLERHKTQGPSTRVVREADFRFAQEDKGLEVAGKNLFHHKGHEGTQRNLMPCASLRKTRVWKLRRKIFFTTKDTEEHKGISRPCASLRKTRVWK
jgi:hypothetical protein